MDFLDLANRRESVRAYSDKPVDRVAVERCLQAARLAPSACNSQPWYFVAVDDPAVRTPLAECLYDAVMNRFVDQAPVLIAVVAETPPLVPRLAGHWKGKPYWLMDIGMAVEHFCLQAASEGLGTCILGWFDEAGVKRVLGVPRARRIPLAITLGYPRGEPRGKARKEPAAVWGWNRYAKCT